MNGIWVWPTEPKQQGKTLADFCRETKRTPEQLKENIADYLRWSGYAGTQIPEAAVKMLQAASPRPSNCGRFQPSAKRPNGTPNMA